MTDKSPGAKAPPIPVELNARQKMDGHVLLQRVKRHSVALVFFDPQYRADLDKLNYGNEGERRQTRRAGLKAMSDDDIGYFVDQIDDVLRPSGHLVLWMDKYGLAMGVHRKWIDRTLDLAIVDLIAWNKLRPGMGKRTRGVAEYAVIIQKIPRRASGVWTDRRLNDCWPETSDRSAHPHAKPYVLTERLIRAVTKRGDLVCDPAAGSYVVLDACKHSGRDFVGCDLVG